MLPVPAVCVEQGCSNKPSGFEGEARNALLAYKGHVAIMRTQLLTSTRHSFFWTLVGFGAVAQPFSETDYGL